MNAKEIEVVMNFFLAVGFDQKRLTQKIEERDLDRIGTTVVKKPVQGSPNRDLLQF
jgi:hypothetical protein